LITAIVLAAGLSRRMGRPKPLLPWGQRTVIECITATLQEAPVDEILVITGHEHAAVARCLAGGPARVVFNPDYAAGEMLSSIQAGLRASSAAASAALLVLGDQPRLERPIVEQVVGAFRAGRGQIVAPSYQMRRGHPLLIGRPYWEAILALADGQTLRGLMRGAGDAIFHVETTSPAVLQDMDTPDEYQRQLESYLSANQV
jgi:molybdenum cofactor cytidylyltransferase